MEAIPEISISEINDPEVDANGRVTVTEKDRGDIEAVLHAISRVQSDLRKIYMLT